MGERIIKTGLSKKYKDMLDAVIGQMSDGYWENTPMMRGYWEFVTTGTSGDEQTVYHAGGGHEIHRGVFGVYAALYRVTVYAYVLLLYA